MTSSKLPSIQYLYEVFDYDLESGALTWREKTNNVVEVGGAAGYIREDGYVEVGLAGHPHRAHRVIWAMLYGYWPDHLIDHKNGIRHDNSFENLRYTDRTLNLQNQRKARPGSKSGLLGVSPTPAGKWRATIRVDGRWIQLGTFPSALIAHTVYVKAKRYLHPACTI